MYHLVFLHLYLIFIVIVKTNLIIKCMGNFRSARQMPVLSTLNDGLELRLIKISLLKFSLALWYHVFYII